MDPSRLQKLLQEESENGQAEIDSGRSQKRTRVTNEDYDVPQSVVQTAPSEVIHQHYHAPVNVVGVAYNSNFGINHGTISQYTAHEFGPGGDLFSILNPIRDASHTRNLKLSPPHSKCLPGTRKAVLSDIRAWANGDLHPSEPHIMWLYGYAGCGKSALAQEIAVQFDDEGLLAASFFFSRGTGDRGAVVRFACTIASQISASIPETYATIEETIKKNRTLLSTKTAPPSLQFERLVYHPIKAAVHSPRKPVLIVLDGVDECGDREEMAGIIESMLLFFDKHPSTPLRILITSRIEDHLHEQLHSSDQVRLLNLVDRTSDADIETALDIEIEKKKKGSRVLACDKSWPSWLDRRKLVEHIGGSFIFMTTVVKLLFDSKLMGGQTPMERLPLILNTKPEFDDLYMSILEPSKDLPHFRDIIGTIALAQEAVSIAQIAELLEVKAPNVASVLINLHAIMRIPGNDRDPITLWHTSLRDFLISEDRSGPFFASPTHHICIARRCIRLAVDPYATAYSRGYALKHLSLFLASGQETSDPLIEALAGLEKILDEPIFGSSSKFASGYPALKVACVYGDWKLVRALVVAKVDINVCFEGWTVLLGALSSRNLDIAYFLLDNGADPNVIGEGVPIARLTKIAKFVFGTGRISDEHSPRGNYHSTPLIFACATGSVELVARLLGHSADTNLTGGIWGSALHECMMWCNIDCARALLEHGADLNLRNKDGFTPLHLACWSWPVTSVKMVQLLLDSGADPLIRDNHGKTALQMALEGLGEECNVVKMLRRRGVVE
ncbi:hypothetical protein NMY22_g132 [Coprinellus aureogranulatus]|nr:hypothetical protein NMY22_g132 [Coprinellus aureogranulatus]